MPTSQVGEMVRGLFASRYFQFSEQKFPLGTFAPRNENNGKRKVPEPFNIRHLNLTSLTTLFKGFDVPTKVGHLLPIVARLCLCLKFTAIAPSNIIM